MAARNEAGLNMGDGLTETAPDQSRGLPRRSWQIAMLLGVGVLVNYFDRVNLSVSHESLIAAFGITNITFGYLSSAYNWTYALCQLPVGVLLDKFGVRRVGRISTFLWSVASFGAAIAPGVPSLFAARFLLGVGEAPTFPANAKAVCLWFPPRKRGLPTAIFDSAAKFSSVLGVPLLGMILLRIGWRASFALTGVLSLLYFFLFSRVYRDPEEDSSLDSSGLASIARENPGDLGREAAKSEPESLGYLLRQRKVIGVAIGFGSYNYVFYLLLAWLPSYLTLALHVDAYHSFLYTSLPWLVAGFADLTVGGWLVDALIRRGYDANRVRRVILIGGTTLGLGILGAAHAHAPTEALLWISLSIGGLSAAAPVGWSVPGLIAARNNVGRVGGIMNFSNQISGVVASTVTGYLFAAREIGWVFGIAGIYLVVGIGAYLFLLGRIEPAST
jgi:MFS transporter, ACS family, D-galactonate transporter